MCLSNTSTSRDGSKTNSKFEAHLHFTNYAAVPWVFDSHYVAMGVALQKDHFYE